MVSPSDTSPQPCCTSSAATSATVAGSTFPSQGSPKHMDTYPRTARPAARAPRATTAEASSASRRERPRLRRAKDSVALTNTATSRAPAARARSSPRSLGTRTGARTPPSSGPSKGPSAASSCSASASCGTQRGDTKLVTSTAGSPAATSRRTSSALTSTGTTADSFCSPSRGPTSYTVTRSGRPGSGVVCGLRTARPYAGPFRGGAEYRARLREPGRQWRMQGRPTAGAALTSRSDVTRQPTRGDGLSPRATAEHAAGLLVSDVERLAAARRLAPAVGRSAALDRLADIAARLLGTASSHVSLLTDVHVVAGGTGLLGRGMGDDDPLPESLCTIAGVSPEGLVVADTFGDERVRH